MMLAPKRDESPVHYWISLFPTAPMFGVKWRFSELSPASTFFDPVDIGGKMAKAAADEAARALEEQTRAAAQKLEEAAHAVEEAAEAIVATMSVVDAPADAASTGVAMEPAAVEAAPEPEAEGEADAAPIAAPATLFAGPPEAVDDLKRIKGVGPRLEQMLNEMGVYRFDQIAAMSPENLAWVDAQLTSFKGRPLRDDWVAQAKALL